MRTVPGSERSATRHGSWLGQVTGLARRGRGILVRGASARRVDAVETLCRRLLTQRGEASTIAIAEQIASAIADFEPAETAAFLGLLARKFDPDHTRIDVAAERWRASRDPRDLQDLIHATEPPRQELLRRLNSADGGTRTIVNLRGSLVEQIERDATLEGVDADFRHLLASWFNPGFLRLERISWETPADILERIIRYEAVHEIRGWDDLRRRLAADRRCYAFFHPSLPREPLIFVEVALTRELPDRIAPLIDPGREVDDTRAASTAVFYSISNCQQGLRGISFGNFLIKRVVTELATELPGLKRFATLSPAPGLAAAVQPGDERGFGERRLRALVGADADRLRGIAGTRDVAEALVALAARGDAQAWPAGTLERLTLAHLMFLRRGTKAADPVAHFHLSNGARLERINLGADTSARGAASCGVMVNYLYDTRQLETNHQRYVESGQLAVGRGLGGLAREVGDIWRRSA